jgi:TetR/AcrR family transcriptional regulator, transcriptional repressor for nem operon
VARPRGFESADVLDAALRCFQLRGFEATSIDNLVQCTGLSRASLYNAFGGKEQLFHAVLDRYEEQQLLALKTRIAQAASPREALRDMLASAASADEELGCLVVNSGMELGPSDPQFQARVAKSLDAIRLMLRDLVRQAGIEDADAVASILQATFLGMRVLARTGTPRKKIFAIACETVGKLL